MSADEHPRFDVLIIGGGNAGISAAARLLKKGVERVAVIEPQTVHTYRPLLSYVGGGEARLCDAERTQRSVTPRKCTWIEDSAVAVDTQRATVQCASGSHYRYGDLIIAAGLVPDEDELPGIDAALRTPAVASNYLDHAEKTWRLIQAMPAGGRAVFTVPRPPVSCTGTTIKPLFLAAAYWQRRGRLNDIDITLVIDRPGFLGVPALDDRLSQGLRRLGVRVLHSTRVDNVDAAERSVAVSTADTRQRLPYDFLHLVPPFRAPRWLQDSGVTDGAGHGLVAIDPETLRHHLPRHMGGGRRRGRRHRSLRRRAAPADLRSG